MLNRISKAWRTAIDTYRLTRFRQKTENTAFGLARKYGIELSDAVWIRDNAPEDAALIVVYMQKLGVGAEAAHAKFLYVVNRTILTMRGMGMSSEQMQKTMSDLKRRAIGDWDE